MSTLKPIDKSMADETGWADFQSKLDEKSKKKAKDELGELNDKDRELAVKTLKDWVLQQEWLKTPTDFDFLLRFLRVRKYSQLGARQTIENYWTVKTKHPDWFHNIDPADEKLQEVLRSGFPYEREKAAWQKENAVLHEEHDAFAKSSVYRMFFMIMKPDKQGRRIFIGREYMIPVETIKKQFGLKNLMRAIALMSEYLVLDENVQVNGLIGLEDMSNMSMGHIYNLWTVEVNETWTKFYEKSLPTRFKGFHIYNEPVFMDSVMAIFKPLMPKKWLERMHLHGKSLVKVYEDLDMSCIPDEYLPDDYEGPRCGTIQQCCDAMIADMNRPEIRNYIVKITNPEYGVNLSLKKKKEEVPQASFRKLNVE